MDRFWERASAKGKDANPYRASFLQLVGVAETDRKAEEEFGRHIEYFYHKLLHLPTVLHLPARQCRLQKPAEHLHVGAKTSCK